jgi:hypothetical protein
MSPPDERDFEFSAYLDARGEDYAAWTPPATYVAPGMPPVLNQGDTPQCVAYSHSTMKSWQDKRDQGKYFDFDEPYFFRLIGGTSAGAVLRNALDRMKSYGYPVVVAGQANLHKIAAYYAISTTQFAIQQAIATAGPVTMGVHWYNSWFYPYSNGVLRSPDYVIGGHAIVAYGWDSKGLRLRNSWGTNYGVNGDVWMPWWMVLSSAVGEVWKSIDVIEGTCSAHVAVSAYAARRKAIIAPNSIVYGYDPKRPGGPVLKYTATAKGSSFSVDAKEAVSWPPPCTTSYVPKGTFLHGDTTINPSTGRPYGGVFAGLLVVPSAVKAADGLPW